MYRYSKCTYKKSIRIDGHVKSIIEKTFREVCRKTGLKLSYGRIARAFWSSLAENPKLRKKCMNLVCKSILKDAGKKAAAHYHERKKSS